MSRTDSSQAFHFLPRHPDYWAEIDRLQAVFAEIDRRTPRNEARKDIMNAARAAYEAGRARANKRWPQEVDQEAENQRLRRIAAFAAELRCPKTFAQNRAAELRRQMARKSEEFGRTVYADGAKVLP
jgi:hypothetical protein